MVCMWAEKQVISWDGMTAMMKGIQMDVYMVALLVLWWACIEAAVLES